MKRMSEIFRKNTRSSVGDLGPHAQEMKDYDDRYFKERGIAPVDQKKWDIRTNEWYEDKTIPLEDEDTVPMPSSREDLDAVEEADTLAEALYEYDNRYSLEAINAGKQSPQMCAEMLLRILNKFDGEMTPIEHEAIAREAIEMGHAIGQLADKPADKTVDRTSLKGVFEMAYIITLAQKYSPEDIPTLEKELQRVAVKVDSRADEGHPISGPVINALREFDKLPEDKKRAVPFTKIVQETGNEQLNESLSRYMERVKIKLEKEEAERLKTEEETKKAEIVKSRLERRKAMLAKLASESTGSFSTRTGMAAAVSESARTGFYTVGDHTSTNKTASSVALLEKEDDDEKKLTAV